MNKKKYYLAQRSGLVGGKQYNAGDQYRLTVGEAETLVVAGILAKPVPPKPRRRPKKVNDG